MEDQKLTAAEKEILVLKAALEAINSIVNYSVLDFNHRDPDSSLLPKTGIHQKYFGILLVDFLKLRVFMVNEDCLESLRAITTSPQFKGNVLFFRNSINEFIQWLDSDVEFEKDGETRALWFPTIDCNIALRITRREFIEVCGNISKHNLLGLDRQARVIQKIFEKNNVSIELTDSLLTMEEFYEQFHNDLFNYHISAICEFLNNIRLGIFEYLQPLYNENLKPYYNEHLKMPSYRYAYPDTIANPYVRKIFWDLMNDIRSGAYMPKFIVNKYLKMRY
jgi:hypothetical protein